MRRRSNKSNKVPNVKLRPAEKGSTSRSALDNCWAQETQPGSDDTTALDLCPRPFKGLAICATGISDKPTIFKQAVELGATHSLAFTDRVTHLVADTHGGPKYNCAVERKVPIVKSSWIAENYQIWLRGDDVDLQKSMEEHRLPIFSGVVVCPSGITDITRRTEIHKLVTAHQGTFLGKLERPVKVTHLLCSGDEETEKMRYAERFNSKGEANIHLVWEEWFWDSLNYGGRFDEETYQVRRPRPEPKPLPETSTPPPPSSDVSSQQDQALSSPAIRSRESQQRPPANNPDEVEDEPAFVNVLPAVTLQLWSGLLERRGYQVTDGEVILSPSKAKGTIIENRNPPSSPVGLDIPAGGSVIASFRRANSFMPAVPPNATGLSSRRLPFRRAVTAISLNDSKAGPSTDVASRAREGSPRSKVPPAGPSKPSTQSRIFAGMSFRVLGEAKTQTVRNAIEGLGGHISTDEDEEATFIIVRLVSGSKIYQQEEDEHLRKKYRTECWLEHCIFEERLCSADEQISFVPLSISIPVEGAENIVMCLSGFDQSHSCSLKRLLRALGISLGSVFNRQSTHLLCQSPAGLKYEKAHEWGIPVVSLTWLKDLAQTGQIPNSRDCDKRMEDVLESGDAGRNNDDIEPMESKKDVKGTSINKGKRVTSEVDNAVDMDVDSRIQDITNTDCAKENPNFHSKKSAVVALGRQNTTIIPAQKPPERPPSVFGLPNELLRGSTFDSLLEEQRRYSSLPTTAACSRNVSMAVDHEDGKSQQESFTILTGVRNGDSLTDPNEQQSAQIPPDDNKQGRVPSSTSPSPLKAPSLQRAGSSRHSLSPVKIDHEATKALQESITSLLGKRLSPDDDLPGVGNTEERTKGARGRKRARPQRSKKKPAPATESSKTNPTRPRTRSSKAADSVAGYVEPSLNPFESYGDELNVPESIPAESQEESIRVMYEDPGQRDEKNRLMNLLKGQASQNSEGLGRPRRSQRIPGF